MNNDLISREALKKELELSKYIVPNALNKLLNSEINRCIEAVDNAPTVEAYTLDQVKDLVELNKKLAEERPQGKWIGSASISWECSRCGYGVNPWNNTPFCPNCGADMKGSAE